MGHVAQRRDAWGSWDVFWGLSISFLGYYPCLADGLSPGELQSQDKFISLSCDRLLIVFCPFWTRKAVSGEGYGAFRKLLMGVCIWF